MRIDASLVETLVASQFPQWAEKPVERVENDGHDNRTFRLGDEMGVRMPSAERYATHVGIEQEWLPRLAPHLPLPVPTPVGRGRPGQGYPWAWTVNGWIRGENASIERISDLSEFARDLAKFLNALQSIDATTAPEPGRHNFFRGGALSVYDGETRECLEAVGDMIDVRAAASAWESALEAEWSGPPVWIHGDVAQDNLLVDDGRLCGVIDFGQLAAGDPSCDVTIAWTLFSGASREAFRSDLAVDEATWARGRGWGLWKALLQLRAGRTSNSEAVARAKRVIRSIIAEG